MRLAAAAKSTARTLEIIPCPNQSNHRNRHARRNLNRHPAGKIRQQPG